MGGEQIQTSEYGVIRESDVVMVCLPPANSVNDPNNNRFLSDIRNKLMQYAHPGMLFILVNPSYPGTANALLTHHLLELGYQVGEDIFIGVAFQHLQEANTTVIGGVTSVCSSLMSKLYARVGKVVIIGSLSAAEMAYSLQTGFRVVNTSLVTEFAMLCDEMGIDYWQVTRDLGYLPFSPKIDGCHLELPGILREAMEYKFVPKLLLSAVDVLGERLPIYILQKIKAALLTHGKSLDESRILLLGMGLSDLEQSACKHIFQSLQAMQGQVSFHDPNLHLFYQDGKTYRRVGLTTDKLQEFDCVVVLVANQDYDYNWLLANSPLVLDCSNTLRGPSVIKLGMPTPSVPRWNGVETRP